MKQNIRVIPVETKRERNAFIKLPWKIYKNDKAWVPPLLLDIKAALSPKHPFFEYGQIQLFLAICDGEYVGRIAAILNPLYNEHHEDVPTGFWGFFECIDHQEVANALFDCVCGFLAKADIKKIHGPVSPSSNYDYGIQISGFEYSPVLLSVHTAPYYQRLVETYGFQKVKTLYAYKFETETARNNPKLERVAKIAMKRYGFKIRPLRLKGKGFKDDVTQIKKIYNEAWEPNWGHVPFTEAEINALGNDLRLIADSSLMLIAEYEGEVVGTAIAAHDYNYIFKQMNGRLLPFNWLKIFTKKKKIEWARVVILGVMPKYQRKGLDAIFYLELIKGAERLGLKYGEGSWILEDNYMIRRGMEVAGGEIYKRYNVYELGI